MGHLRELAKRSAPSGFKRNIRRLRNRFTGPGLDEVEYGEYTFAPDSNPKPRLTLVAPTLDSADAMGGANTYVELFISLASRLRRGADFDARVIVTNTNPGEPVGMLHAWAGRTDFPVEDIEIHSGARARPEITTRPNEIFLATNWYGFLNIMPLVEGQERVFGRGLTPFYLVQDYTANFHGLSSVNLLNRFAIEHPRPHRMIYNSQQLHAYYVSHHGPSDRDYVFGPRLPESLHPHLSTAGSVEKELKLLVYGRPSQARNCFSIIRRAMAGWARLHPGAVRWEVLSVGEPHPPVPLGNGQEMRSLGKLSIDAYGRLLQEASVGLSLMASPHPSYPPLEMAHFGLLTVTNTYECKDLEKEAHTNITSVTDVRPDAIGRVLSDLCTRVETDRTIGRSGKSHMPDYAVRGPFECLDALVADMTELVRQPATEPGQGPAPVEFFQERAANA